MAIIPRGSLLSTTVVTGFLVNGTDGWDVLDDLSHMSTGATYDPGTDDTVNGFGGHDAIYIHNGNDTVNGGEGSDDIYDWGTGNDVMNGDGGNDYFFIGLGNDIVNGGDGNDTVSYRYSQQFVGLDLEGGYAISEGYDTLISIENAWGGSGYDTLLGSSVANELIGFDGNDWIEGRGGDDRLRGDAGHDTIDGGAGADEIWGGQGDDVMIGGDGADWFYFQNWSDFYEIDTIKDFEQGVDKIDVSAIDARPDLYGNQAFTFDATPDGSYEEWVDGLDNWGAFLASAIDPSPVINGDTGEIEYRHDGGYTYIYLSNGDHYIDASIRLEGTIYLTASDFIL
jgi:Ca2+-binding RTX toxin-like protein